MSSEMKNIYLEVRDIDRWTLEDHLTFSKLEDAKDYARIKRFNDGKERRVVVEYVRREYYEI